MERTGTSPQRAAEANLQPASAVPPPPNLLFGWRIFGTKAHGCEVFEASRAVGRRNLETTRGLRSQTIQHFPSVDVLSVLGQVNSNGVAISNLRYRGLSGM